MAQKKTIIRKSFTVNDLYNECIIKRKCKKIILPGDVNSAFSKFVTLYFCLFCIHVDNYIIRCE